MGTKHSGKEVQPMDDSLEHIFVTMMHQGEILDAVDYIRSIDCQYIPSQIVMRKLIFQILMKSDDVKCLSKASAYLISVINVYPPRDEESRSFYSSSVVEADGYLSDLWNVLYHIVISYSIHHKIYVLDDAGPDTVKYPNCKILLEFYIRLIGRDLEHMKHESYKTCLIMDIFWPGGDVCMNSRTENLLKWINDVYSGTAIMDQWAHLQKNLHELLIFMVKFIIHGKHDLVEVLAFNHHSLTEITENIANFCRNAFATLNSLKLFLSYLPLKCLRAKVSEKMIRMITKQSAKPYSILTLKEIVYQHMFPQKCSRGRRPKERVLPYRKKVVPEKIDKSKLEFTNLHQLCKDDKFADLMIALRTDYGFINTRDPSGNTPLFIACQLKYHMCVRILISESGKGPVPKLDASLGNFEGVTPLHVAVKQNATNIVKMLLDHGGTELLNVADNKDLRPSDLDQSEAMEKLLKEYQAESTELNPIVEESIVKEAPTFKTFQDYSKYLHALNCLLCTYADLFQLYNLAWKKSTFTQSHGESMCCHFVNDNFACSEDAALLSELPELIETFIDSLYKNVTKSQLNISIDLELLPLKAFKSSIEC